MVGLISAILVFTLNVNGLYACLKRQGSLTSPRFYSTLYWKRQLGKKNHIGKEKLSSPADIFSVYKETPKQPTKYLLALINEFSSVVECKSTYKN